LLGRYSTASAKPLALCGYFVGIHVIHSLFPNWV
jgi:hypothetical protein